MVFKAMKSNNAADIGAEIYLFSGAKKKISKRRQKYSQKLGCYETNEIVAWHMNESNACNDEQKLFSLLSANRIQSV